MDSHRRAVLHRALATAAVVATAATTALVGAPPAGAHGTDECRAYAPVAHPFVKIVAEGNQFDADCLKAPADRDFRIYLRNNDADPHNISIYATDPGKDKKAEQIFKGKAIKGPGQEEYAVDALPGGTYYFQDDKTPGMKGVVQIPTKKK
ncbi:MAG: hypothetical protein QOE80_262 [Actinomycetota bacterium]|nr:hypothetical protein [Actinomycetota bacterium]